MSFFSKILGIISKVIPKRKKRPKGREITDLKQKLKNKGYDIPKFDVLTAKNKRYLNQLVKAKTRKAEKRIINKIFRRNQSTLKGITNQLEKTRDISKIDYYVENLSNKPKSKESENIILNAVVNSEYGVDTLKEVIGELNEQEAVEQIGNIDLENIYELDKKARQFLENVVQSPDVVGGISSKEYLPEIEL